MQFNRGDKLSGFGNLDKDCDPKACKNLSFSIDVVDDNLFI